MTGIDARERWTLASLSLLVLLPSLATSIANVGLPALGEAFSASFQAVQWVVLAYLLAMTTLIVAAGRLGDIVGHRRLTLAGIGLFTAASLACAFAPTLQFLVVARAAQGLGAAAMLALGMAMVGATIPKARTGAAMGLLGSMSAIGTTLGPALGGMLISSFGWQAIFLVNVPVGVLAALLAIRALPEDRMETVDRPPFDNLGLLLLALTLAAYALAMTVNLALLPAAVAGMALFMLSQTRTPSPLLRLEMFRDPALSAGLMTSLLVSAVMMSTLVVGPFYLAEGLGLDAAGVGWALSAGPLAAALAGMPAGRLADRFGAGRMIVAGLVGMAAGLLALSLAAEAFGVAGYIAAIVLVTVHYAVFQAANNTAVMADAPADRRGAVSGVLSLSRNLGLITGASALGAVFALATSRAEIAAAYPQAVTAGMKATFLAAAALVGVGILAVAFSTRRRAPPPVLDKRDDEPSLVRARHTRGGQIRGKERFDKHQDGRS